jgi:hypothetical protein
MAGLTYLPLNYTLPVKRCGCFFAQVCIGADSLYAYRLFGSSGEHLATSHAERTQRTRSQQQDAARFGSDC